MSYKSQINFVFKTVIISSALIILYGLYAVYEIFYANYFSQVHFELHLWPGRSDPPTKAEIIFTGFTNLKLIGVTTSISIIVVLLFHKLKK
jgi:hypothetical protein